MKTKRTLCYKSMMLCKHDVESNSTEPVPLDALLLWQECRDLIGVIALGSAQSKPDIDLHSRLLQAKTLLCSLDADDAGAKAAVFWRRYPGFKRWPTVKGKDPNEMRLAGVSVRSWIMAAFLERNCYK